MKWSIVEDYIVCQFYFAYINSWREHMDVVMTELSQAGFGAREEKSVRMRLQNYEYLHTQKKGLSNAAKQSQRIYDAFAQRRKNVTVYSQLNVYINTVVVEDESSYVEGDLLDTLSSKSNNTTEFIYTEPLGPSFQDVLFGFIDERGMKDSDVYNACLVGRDTFSHIRKGDKGVSKRTVMQLCFGLKLNYEEAMELMASAGYAFGAHILTDAIVAYYLKNGMYDIHDANITLYENKADLLFST